MEETVESMRAQRSVDAAYDEAEAFLGISAAEIRQDDRVRLIRDLFVGHQVTFGKLVEAIMVVATEPQRRTRQTR